MGIVLFSIFLELLIYVSCCSFEVYGVLSNGFLFFIFGEYFRVRVIFYSIWDFFGKF